MNEKNNKLNDEQLNNVSGGYRNYTCRDCGYCERETNLEIAPSGFICSRTREDIGSIKAICFEFITTDF